MSKKQKWYYIALFFCILVLLCISIGGIVSLGWLANRPTKRTPLTEELRESMVPYYQNPDKTKELRELIESEDKSYFLTVYTVSCGLKLFMALFLISVVSLGVSVKLYKDQ